MFVCPFWMLVVLMFSIQVMEIRVLQLAVASDVLRPLIPYQKCFIGVVVCEHAFAPHTNPQSLFAGEKKYTWMDHMDRYMCLCLFISILLPCVKSGSYVTCLYNKGIKAALSKFHSDILIFQAEICDQFFQVQSACTHTSCNCIYKS